MFARIQIYCAGNCCFNDIQKSNKPTVIINTEHIICVGPRTTWGFCSDHKEYPFRIVEMSTGLKFQCVLESANELVELIKQDHGTITTELSEEDEITIKDICDKLNRLSMTYVGNESIACQEDIKWLKSLKDSCTWKPSDLPHWKKSTLPDDNTTGLNSDYFCYKGYNINYKELFEKLPKDD